MTSKNPFYSKIERLRSPDFTVHVLRSDRGRGGDPDGLSGRGQDADGGRGVRAGRGGDH